MPNLCQELFTDLMKHLNGSFLDIMLHFLSINKEGKQAIEVIKELLGEGEQWLATKIQKMAEETAALHTKASQFIQGENEYEVAALFTVVYGLYYSNHIDLMGDALKQCTPNLKKKKDASIDKFKAEVLK